MVRVVKVLIDGPSDLEFYYGIPDSCEGRVDVGSRVHVPLRARQATGTVLSIEDLEVGRGGDALRRSNSMT